MLRGLRQRAGLTQEQLAERSKLSVNAVSALERGERRHPHPSTVRALAAALQLSAGEHAALNAAVPRRGQRLPVPRELPADTIHFTGRHADLARLDAALPDGEGDRPTAVVTAINGTAGVGKTALAVHWAHQVRDRFPDGCLYLDLRGYDPGQPLDSVDGLAVLLRSLGVADSGIPHEAAERVTRYRTLLDKRRMLIVLDNAFSAEQVRPLLPGTPSCFVVVTSRDGLAGLVAREGATRIDLDVLPPADALALLGKLVGRDRVEAEPAAAAGLVQRCARLPLALRVAAEVAAARPAESLAGLAAELDRYRLDVLMAGGDDRADVRAVFSWSYKHLPAEAARVFRLLGLHPGPDIDAYAAAALADTTAAVTRQLLDALRRAHLVQETAPSRFGMHDLLRAYAAERAADDPEPDRRAALTRLFDHYAHTTSLAAEWAYPQDWGYLPRVPAPPTLRRDFADQTEAVAWLETERLNLLAAAEHAATHGWPAHSSRLSRALARHLRTRSYHAEALILHTHALHATRGISDRAGESNALVSLGEISLRVGRYEQAIDHHQQALAVAREVGDRVGEGRALGGLGGVYGMVSRYEQAVDHYQQALAVAREVGDRTGASSALFGLGEVYRLVGRHDQAVGHYQQALAVARDVGDRANERHALSGLGDVYRQMGWYDQAIDHHQQALAVAREVGDRYGEGYALLGLGNVYRRVGRYEQAIDHLQQALAVAREIGHRAGESYALLGLGNVYRLVGRYEQAISHHQQGLAIACEIGDRNGEFEAHNGLGETLRATNQPAQALTHHQHAATLAVELGQPHDHARALDGIAHAHHDLGHHDLGHPDLGHPGQARHHWQQALQIFTQLATPEADQVRAHLATLHNHDDARTDPDYPDR
jgi:tetratricopeptide (TPR) repeat protein/transcriptional regulator with XRE-family HTH domain